MQRKKPEKRKHEKAIVGKQTSWAPNIRLTLGVQHTEPKPFKAQHLHLVGVSSIATDHNII